MGAACTQFSLRKPFRTLDGIYDPFSAHVRRGGPGRPGGDDSDKDSLRRGFNNYQQGMLPSRLLDFCELDCGATVGPASVRLFHSTSSSNGTLAKR
jgi:hypothetical protein